MISYQITSIPANFLKSTLAFHDWLGSFRPISPRPKKILLVPLVNYTEFKISLCSIFIDILYVCFKNPLQAQLLQGVG